MEVLLAVITIVAGVATLIDFSLVKKSSERIKHIIYIFTISICAYFAVFNYYEKKDLENEIIDNNLSRNIDVLSFKEFKTLCKESSPIVSAISSSNQTKYNAIEAAIATGKLRLLEQTKEITIDGRNFGTISFLHEKEPVFIPSGSKNTNGESLGYAKVWLKINCDNFSTYLNMLHIKGE